MQGNGSFCTHTQQFFPPIRLHLVSSPGKVNLIATFGDQEVCIACFHGGMYDPQVIPEHKAAKMGIHLDSFGHIIQRPHMIDSLRPDSK